MKDIRYEIPDGFSGFLFAPANEYEVVSIAVAEKVPESKIPFQIIH